MLVIALAGAFWIAGNHGYFLCVQDCGEAFIAQHQAKNFSIYGFRYGLIEDHATSIDPAAHPYLYTHNVNIGNLVFALLEALGLGALQIKTAVTISAFGIGMAYAYRAVAFHARSRIFALLVLAFLLTDIEQVLAFAANPLRAWHWMALFGTIFHVGRIAAGTSASAAVDRIAIPALAFVAFGIGYDFLAISLAISIAVLLLCRSDGRPVAWREILLLLAAFVAWPVLRQFQVMAVMGPEFWIRDLYYSVAIKVPFVSSILPLPTIEEIDQYYAGRGVLRPPSRPTESTAEIFNLAWQLLWSVTVVTQGSRRRSGVACFMLFLAGYCSLLRRLRGASPVRSADRRRY